MRKKGLITICLTTMISLSLPILSYAMERVIAISNADGTVTELWSDDNWYLLQKDGTYAKNCWLWLDSNNDGVAECYCFGEDGHFYMNTVTPDNYTVNITGAWTVDGVVQTKAVEPIQ